jgi:hypothetical protein
MGHWAAKRTAAVMQPPTLDTPWQDAELLVALPLVRQFFQDVLAACPRSRAGSQGGRNANWEGMLALLFTLAVCHQTYANKALSMLKGQTRFLEVLASAFGVEKFELPSGSSFSRLGPELAQVVIAKVKETMALLYAVLDSFFAPDPVGQVRLTLDASRVPAWVRQVGGGNRWSHRDLGIRGRLTEAGFRAYVHKSNGVKQHMNPDTAVAGGYIFRGNVVFWRGYYLSTLCVPRYRGLPRVLTLGDASINEEDHTAGLFSDAVRHEPHLMGSMVITDSGYDIKDWVSRAARDYAFDVVARPAKNNKTKQQGPQRLQEGDAVNETIRALTPEGQAICNTHGTKFDYRGHRKADRDKLGLKPGQEAPAGDFAVRFNSPDSCNTIPATACGQPQLRSLVNWRRLVRYPMYPDGDPERYAIRLASLGQLNYHEAYHKRLKSMGHAVNGTARTHIIDDFVVEALLQLAAFAMVAAAVADRTMRVSEPLDPANGALKHLHIPSMPQRLLVA